MSEARIKFYSTKGMLFQEQSKAESVVKDDITTYLLKIDTHHIDILENKNQILCTFFCDISECLFDEKARNLKVFLKENKDSEPILNIELHSSSAGMDVLKEIMENINERKSFLKYKGPLSYNPARAHRTSLLSTESPEQNFRGFLNAAGLVLLANNLRSIIDNAKVYGIQLNNMAHSPLTYFEPAAFLSAGILLAQVLFAFTIQKLNFKGIIAPKTTWILNALNVTSVLITPVAIKLISDMHIFPSIILIIISCVIWLKLISYAHVWRNVYFLVQRIKEFKTDENKKKKELSEIITESEASSDVRNPKTIEHRRLNYFGKNFEMMKKNYKTPENLLRIGDLFYFLAAPTLCFQIIYPRTQRIRLLWLTKRIVELIIILLFQSVLWHQYLNPLLEETYEMQKNPKNKTVLFLLERMLKLSMPNLYFWISGFFGFFQVFLNITAELLRYGDRQFYLDWWNCRDMEQYWKLWNLPVHNWCVRHFYYPLLKRGISKSISNFFVFTLSAFLHEWIISGTLSVFGYHAFLAMMMQAPIIIFQRKLTKILKLENSQLGNLFFWLSFCFIGQPAAILLYYEIYRNKYG